MSDFDPSPFVSAAELVGHAASLFGDLRFAKPKLDTTALDGALAELADARVGYRRGVFPVRLTDGVDAHGPLLGRIRAAAEAAALAGSSLYADDLRSYAVWLMCTVPVCTGYVELAKVSPDRVFIVHLGDLGVQIPRDEFEAELARLPACSELRAAYLFSCLAGDDAIERMDLSGLAHLRLLHLAQNELTRVPTWLPRCQQLEVLDLSRNPLEGVAELGRMTSLRRLDLRGTGCAEDAVAGLRATLPGCEVQA